MSSAGPQQPEGNHGNGSHRASRGLRSLPGFTTAAVVFVLIVLMGVGGIAIAKWNQTATVAIAITAGAAATTSPPPTTAPPTTTSPTTAPPTTTPPAGSGNIVAAPVIATRPQTIVLVPNVSVFTCKRGGNVDNANANQFKFDWPASGSNVTHYVVSLSRASNGFQQSQTVTTNTASFKPGANPTSGNYVLRVLPMNGTVAGDPVYTTLRYGSPTDQNCEQDRRTGSSPLGQFSYTAVAASSPGTTNDNIVNLTWNPAATQATSYVVSIQPTTESSNFGAEFQGTTTGAKLIFPARVLQDGRPGPSAPFYGEYLLRVVPMNNLQAGDPVYKKVVYKAWETTTWDWAIGWG